MHHNRRQRARAALASPVSPGTTTRSNAHSAARSDGVMGEDFWRPREQDDYFQNAVHGSQDTLQSSTDSSEQSHESEHASNTSEAESSSETPGSSGSAPDREDWKAAPDVGTLGRTWDRPSMVRFARARLIQRRLMRCRGRNANRNGSRSMESHHEATHPPTNLLVLAK